MLPGLPMWSVYTWSLTTGVPGGVGTVVAVAVVGSTTVTGAWSVIDSDSPVFLTVTPAVSGPPSVASGSAWRFTVTCCVPVQLMSAFGRTEPSAATFTGVAAVPTAMLTVSGRRRKPAGRLGWMARPLAALQTRSKPIV